MEMSNLSYRAKEDLRLIKRAIENNDQEAYSILLKKYQDSIYYMMYKMVKNKDLADDLTIEAFGKAFLNIDRYKPKFAFSTWLFRIAINNCIDYIRKKELDCLYIDKNIKDTKGEDYKIELESKTLSPEERIIKNQRIKIMRKIVDKLTPKYRKLIVMRYFRELSYEEISTKLKIPIGTVKAQLFRARELLYMLIKESKDIF